METYTALKKNSQKMSYKVAVILFGVALIVLGLSSMQIASAVFGAFLIYLALYSKTVVVDATGVTSFYHAVFFRKSIVYPFEEFQGILGEAGDAPEMNLGFVRNGMAHYSLFTRADGEAIIRLAKEANPKIHIKRIRPRKRNFF